MKVALLTDTYCLPASSPVRRFQKGLWEMSAMWIESEFVVYVLSILVQVIGVAGVLAARLNSGKQRQRRYDVLAIGCFALVGILSILLIPRASSECWLAFATTMPLMAVGATLDLKKPHGHRGF